MTADRFAPPGSTYELGIAIAQLRHAYKQIVNGEVRDWQSFAKGLLAPQIERLERFHQTLIPPRELLARLRDCAVNEDNPDTCGVCGQHFTECDADQRVRGEATEAACAGARAREPLRPREG